MARRPAPLEVVLVNIRSRFNVGAIFRTADAVGVTKIHLCGYTPAPPHPKIDKVSLGAEKTVPFEVYRTGLQAVKKARQRGLLTIGLEQSQLSQPYHQFRRPARKSLALIVGNEVTGVPRSVLRACDVRLEIPMLGRKESLNVAVAFGIVAYRLTFA